MSENQPLHGQPEEDAQPADERLPSFDEATEVALVGEGLERLLEDEGALPELEEALHTGDTAAFRNVVERNDLTDRIELICRWICTWHVQRRCLWVCRDHQMEELKTEQLTEVALGLAALAKERGLDELLDAIDAGDGDRFEAILDRHGLRPYCRLVCTLVLTVRCELFCLGLTVDGPGRRPRDPIDVLTDLIGAVGRIAESQQLPRLVRAYEAQRYDVVQRLLDELGLLRWCRLVCLWLCVVVPFLHCIRICREFPPPPLDRIPRPGDPGPIREWAKVTAGLARREDAVEELVRAVRRGDDDRFAELVRELDLVAWCHYLCFWLHRVVCYRVCFLICPPRPPLPLFYRLGNYSFPSDVATNPGGSGLTIADGRAFHGNVRLNGSDLQQTHDGGQAEYRFEVNVAGGGWNPVLPNQIAPTRIGAWTAAGADPRDYVVNGNAADPDQIVVVPSPDGWIAVPPEDSFWTAEGTFTSNGDFVRLITTSVVPTAVHDVAAVDGGDGVPPAERGSNTEIGVRMRWRKVGDAGNGLITGTAHVVSVNNDRWDNVAKGGSWLGQRADGQPAVVSVDVDEIGPGCDEVDDQLHVRYTAAHPQLGAVSLSMSGPVPVSLTMTDDGAATADNRFGVAESTPPPADLPECAYLVTLTATLLLTTGDSVPNPVHDQVAFHVEHS